jgi:hypothetical protein
MDPANSNVQHFYILYIGVGAALKKSAHGDSPRSNHHSDAVQITENLDAYTLYIDSGGVGS